MSTTIGFDGVSLVIRVPMAWQGFNEGQMEGMSLLLEKVRSFVGPELIAHARAAVSESDEMVRLVSKLKAEKSAAKAEGGVAGLVAHRRFLATKEEEISAASEILVELKAKAEQTISAIVAAIGGKHLSLKVDSPEVVAVLLASIEKLVAQNGSALANHLGTVEGFANAVRRFSSRDAAEALVAAG